MKTHSILSVGSACGQPGEFPNSARHGIRSILSVAVKSMAWAACALCLSSAPVRAQDGADFLQQNVDDLVSRIQTRLKKSIDSPDWEKNYQGVSRNIEDLRKTLAQGGVLKSNPVKRHHKLVIDMLTERKIDFEAFYKAQLRLQNERGDRARRLINDVGLEMISRITPKPGILTPITQARAQNAEVIKQQFLELRSIDKAIAYLDELMKSIKPSIRELVLRRNALVPLLTQFNSLDAGFDGSYGGKFSGEAAGSISFTINGTSVSGTVSGSYQGDSIRGKFTGVVDRFGYLDTTLSGTLTDNSSMNLGSFPFNGAIKGNVTGSSGKGTWAAKNGWATLNGSWSVVRK